MRVLANSSSIELFQNESESLGSHFTVLYVAPGIIQPKETLVILVIISDISAKHWRITKHIVLEKGIEPPPFTVNGNNDEETVELLSESTDYDIAAVHYESKRNRETHMQRQKMIRHSRKKPILAKDKNWTC